jgi:O-antigen/teichoic acid export membrane protein
LGHGFRNKFAEAIAVKNVSLARTYVSTTFVLLSIIIALVLMVFLIINPFLNWQSILNTSVETRRTLSTMANIVFVFFAFQFIFKLTTSMLLADQKSSLVDLIGVSGSVLSLIIISILIQTNRRSLLFLGLVLSACPVMALIAAYFLAFNGKYKIYRPSIKFVDIKQSRDLVGLGFLFFIPQICSLIVFSTSNVIITQIFTPVEVTIYNIVYKYFMLITVFFQILVTPFWSAFTEAFLKKDTLWINNVTNKLVIFWVFSCLGVVVMIVMSKWIFFLWLGEKIVVHLQLMIAMAAYVCVANWNNIFVSFNNGVSKVFIQVWLSVFAGIVFIPLAIIMSKNIGLIGVPLAMTLSILPGSIISPIQYKKLISEKALGIWNK